MPQLFALQWLQLCTLAGAKSEGGRKRRDNEKMIASIKVIMLYNN